MMEPSIYVQQEECTKGRNLLPQYVKKCGKIFTTTGENWHVMALWLSESIWGSIQSFSISLHNKSRHDNKGERWMPGLPLIGAVCICQWRSHLPVKTSSNAACHYANSSINTITFSLLKSSPLLGMSNDPHTGIKKALESRWQRENSTTK